MKRHIEECIGTFQQVAGQKCLYYLRGTCWRGEQCRFVNDEAEEFVTQNIPNGRQCGYVVNGVCRCFQSSIGVQNQHVIMNPLLIIKDIRECIDALILNHKSCANI